MQIAIIDSQGRTMLSWDNAELARRVLARQTAHKSRRFLGRKEPLSEEQLELALGEALIEFCEETRSLQVRVTALPSLA